MMIDARSEEMWKFMRKRYLTASDAANYCGVNPYDKDGKLHLWMEKTGKYERPDISDKPAVIFGKETEPTLRRLFLNLHPEFVCEYHRFGLYVSPLRRWMAATLDGLLKDRSGDISILEIKTGTVRDEVALSNWTDDPCPANYYLQVLHQLVCIPEAQKVHMLALIKCAWNPEQHYIFERTFSRNDAEIQKDTKWLLKHADHMHECIEKDTHP